MGQVKHILFERRVPRPRLNNRAVVEVSENIHVHWRNLRLEFSKREFFDFLCLLHGVAWDDVATTDCDPDGCVVLSENHSLPPATEWDDRLVVEQQVEGHFHMHYRNLRIEVDDPAELSPSIAASAAIWNSAIEAALQCIPGGTHCDPQDVADTIRELKIEPSKEP